MCPDVAVGRDRSTHSHSDMRTLAIITNLLLLAIIGSLVARGEISIEAEYLPLFLLMLAAPILSIIALLLKGVASKDWLSRYFERRATEERQKLRRLSAQSGQPGAAPNDGPTAPTGTSGVTERPQQVS